MELTAAESLVVAASPEACFERAVVDLSFLPRGVARRRGTLPAVVRAEVVGGGALGLGAVRRVHLSDGGVLDEEVAAWEPGRRMAYRQLLAFPWPNWLLVRGARGEYRFEPHDRGTLATWGATFELTTPLAWPAAALAVRFFARPVWRDFLAQLRREAEGG